MKKVKICLLLLVVALTFVGTGWAVNYAPNGKGDLIFFPWYFTAPGGYETKLSVINTSPEFCTVAKVIVRTPVWSDEVLDFLIFLSPNDVWTGKLYFGPQGPALYSEDDSILVNLPGPVGAVDSDFASPASPVDFPLYAPACTDDFNNYGYVEVIESAATTTLPFIPGTKKVAKTKIYDWYAALANDAPAATDQPANILTAYQEFSNMNSGLQTLRRAFVFEYWGNLTKLDAVDVTGLTNPAMSEIYELEMAMAKMDVSMPYINKANGDFAIHIFNFPTKLSLENQESSCDDYVPFEKSPFFSKRPERCIEFIANVYDLLENTPSTPGNPFSGGDPGEDEVMCDEVSLLSSIIEGDLFREGWIRYNWKYAEEEINGSTAQISKDYEPTPVLPSVLYFTANAWAEADAAWTNICY